MTDLSPESPEVAAGSDGPASANTGQFSKKMTCSISGKDRPKKDLTIIDTLRPALADRIRKDFPGLPQDAMISSAELARYRTKYVEEMLKDEHGEFSELDRAVVESIANQDTIAENIEEEFDEHRTFADRVSDGLAAVGSSWGFIIGFLVMMSFWMALNVLLGDKLAFDAYPFILLNLVLSCLAAIQAPIIMMSQKRQEQKDRLRSKNEYQVNLKAELEIRHLHEKIDHLITRQWQRLAEIQQLQLEIMQEGRKKK